MPRFFTLPQAEQLLPEVASAIQHAVLLKAEYANCEAESRNLSERVSVMGGVRVDRAQFEQRKRRSEVASRALQLAIERVHEFGCLVKDLDIGLIDFPTLWNGQEVYLCWRLGEPAIQFWHGMDEGFRGRKPIDAEFLEKHTGELPS